MSTPIDRLEKLIKKATPGPWRQSERAGCSDVIVAGPARETYILGRMVAENVGRPDIDLILAAVNALPGLLKVARAVKACIDDANHREERYDEHWAAWQAEFPDGEPEDSDPDDWNDRCPCQWCVHEREVHNALEPLTREDGQ